MDYAHFCDCDYDEQSKLVGIMCKHCKIIEDEGIAKNKWYKQIKKVSAYVKLTELQSNKEDRIIIVIELYEYLMTLPELVAEHKKFRTVTIEKVIKFKEEEDDENLIKTFDKFLLFIEELKNHPGYEN
jgi:Rad3-related DNA helicase